MFGAGWTEMLIIGVVALVVIGPKDLPIVMRKLEARRRHGPPNGHRVPAQK